MTAEIAATVFCALTAGVVIFQLALAAGAPWGQVAMGGKYPGRFPRQLRIAAIVQALVLVGLGAVVLTRAGLIFPQWLAAATWLIWGVVAFSALALALNLITPSKWERILWAPVAAGMLLCSVIVAVS
jgi:hypothetical protein